MSVHFSCQSFAQVLPDLYLSDVNSAQNLDLLVEKSVTHILNLTGPVGASNPKERYPNKFHERFTYYHLCLADEMNVPISDYFHKLHTFIDEGRSRGKVLVHCEAGISRSSTVVISYLMRTAGLSLKEAYFQVFQQKPNIGPNQNFFQQLIEFEKSLFKVHQASLTLIQYLTHQMKNGVASNFSESQIEIALTKSSLNPNDAINYLFS